jgi:hypothetical protein
MHTTDAGDERLSRGWFGDAAAEWEGAGRRRYIFAQRPSDMFGTPLSSIEIYTP